MDSGVDAVLFLAVITSELYHHFQSIVEQVVDRRKSELYNLAAALLYHHPLQLRLTHPVLLGSSSTC